MRTISKPECREWLKANIGGDFTVEKVEGEYVYGVAYLVPSDTGKKTALGRALIAVLQVKSPGLFWITATGIWPSSENMALFDGYRRSFGENRPIHAAPAHVFDGSDLVQLECLLDLALYFYWDSLLFEGPEGVAVKTSHDEYISVRAKDPDRLSRIERNLIELGLKAVDGS
jgi:hypothetical protein